MKILISLIFTLTLSNTIGQTVFDKSVSTQYINLYRKLPARFQNEFNKQDSPAEDGLAIFTEYICDTLNKIEQKEPQLPEIIDMKTNKPVKSGSKKEKYPMFFCYGLIRNDTLGIQISDIFLDQGLMQFVTAKYVSISYIEHHKNENILKIKETDGLTNALIVPVKISRFVLSNPGYKAGDIIYGSGEIVTNSYFIKDDWQENHFYKIRWRLKY